MILGQDVTSGMVKKMGNDISENGDENMNDSDDDDYLLADIFMYTTSGSPSWIDWRGRNPRLYR